MKSRLSCLFALTFIAGPLGAEFLSVEQSVSGLDCISCAQSVDKALKKIRGVETASFRAQDATEVLALKPGNAVPLKEVRDTLKRIGYTPGAAKVTARGQARMEGGKWFFRVAGEDTDYPMDVDADLAGQLRGTVGTVATVEASLAEPSAPLKLRAVRRGE